MSVPPGNAPIPLEPMPAIEADLACAVCGYNLKGLSPDGACPECGRAIERTTGAGLSQSDAAWLRGRARSVLFLAALSGVTYGIGNDSAYWMIDSSFRVRYVMNLMVQALWAGLAIYGALTFSTPEANRAVEEQGGDAWRRGLWVASGAYAIAFVILAFPASSGWQVRPLVGYVIMGATLALHWLIPFHVHRLARRSNSPSLVGHATFVLWAYPLQLVVLGILLYYFGTWRVNARAVDAASPVVIAVLALLPFAASAIGLAYFLLLGRMYETLLAAGRDATPRVTSAGP
jgi:hypothetical protein